jgi:hypothetical protein
MNVAWLLVGTKDRHGGLPVIEDGATVDGIGLSAGNVCRSRSASSVSGRSGVAPSKRKRLWPWSAQKYHSDFAMSRRIRTIAVAIRCHARAIGSLEDHQWQGHHSKIGGVCTRFTRCKEACRE